MQNVKTRKKTRLHHRDTSISVKLRLKRCEALQKHRLHTQQPAPPTHFRSMQLQSGHLGRASSTRCKTLPARNPSQPFCDPLKTQKPQKGVFKNLNSSRVFKTCKTTPPPGLFSLKTEVLEPGRSPVLLMCKTRKSTEERPIACETHENSYKFVCEAHKRKSPAAAWFCSEAAKATQTADPQPGAGLHF